MPNIEDFIMLYESLLIEDYVTEGRISIDIKELK